MDTQLLACVISAVAVLLLGPSTILSKVLDQSQGLWIGGLSMLGAGVGLNVCVCPLVYLSVMWATERKTKDQVAGTIIAVNRLGGDLANGIASPIISVVTDMSGISIVSSILFAIIVGLCIPMVLYLHRYTYVHPPVKGPLAKYFTPPVDAPPSEQSEAPPDAESAKQSA